MNKPQNNSKKIENVDQYGRVINYLRISVTDKCNLRCIYCLPPEGIALKPKKEILTWEEIYRVVLTALDLGFTKIRLTGGEPLIRKGIIDFIVKLSALEKITDLSLTTNGILLKKYAHDLVKAGLKRVNISLDTLEPDKFHWITGKEELKTVLAGIESAVSLGLSPVKLNVVVMKGINDDEIIDFIDFASVSNVWVRFIEFMPANKYTAKHKDYFISNQEIKEKIIQTGIDLRPITRPLKDTVAQYYTFADNQSRIGFISPISRPFCSQCNKLRLTPSGLLKNCLFTKEDVDIKSCLRNSPGNEELRKIFLYCLKTKPENYDNNMSDHCGYNMAMSEIGG